MIWILYFVIFLALIYTIHYNFFSLRSKLRYFGGPTPIPLIGNVLMFKNFLDLLPIMVNACKQLDGLCLVQAGPFRQILVIDNYEWLEFVFNNNKLITKAFEYKSFHRWLGSGLLTSTGQKWKNHRRIITPTFHFQILEQFIPIFIKESNRFAKKLSSEATGKSFDIYPYVNLCTLDIICESAMGTSVNAQEDNESDYVRSVRDMCRIVVDRGFSAYKMIDFLYAFTNDYRIEMKALNVLHTYSNNVIKQRRQELLNRNNSTQNGDEFGRKKRTAFLDMLLEANVDGEPLSDNDIREEVDTFMFEGHDTVSSAVGFTLYSLANHPEVQETAYNEQVTLLGKEKDAQVTITNLNEMKYLELVIKEALRLYPSVPFFAREVVEDVEFNGIVLPKGLTVLLFAFGIQRNEKFYPDPLKFDPLRFEGITGTTPFSYVPFSAGSRNCIGQKFAFLEMKCILSRILREYVLLPSGKEEDVQLKAETILKSHNGLHVRLQKRD